MDKLTPGELKWLDQFVDEYVNANFKKYRKRILPKIEEPRVTKGGLKRKRDVYKYDSYKRNNARNSDVYTKEKAAGILNSIDDVKKLIPSPENSIIRKLDRQMRKKRDQSKNAVKRAGNKAKRTKNLK